MSRIEWPSDAPIHHVRGPRRLALAVCLVLSACSSAPRSGALPEGSAEPSPTSAATSDSPIATRTPAATPSASSVTAETRPPGATLGDAAGHDVIGQVGTFQWAGIVSSSPLLAGSPVTVKPDQELRIAAADAPPTNWRATLYRDAANPASGQPSREGAWPVSLRAPSAAGTWTLAVQLFYPNGDVLHFWRLTVIE